ncbi:MAG: transglycosylase domain-containing protein, partial [Actinobacteria bacterium]|nr:transglycosylase domain-containing protein [Actinomycetota bacterium]
MTDRHDEVFYSFGKSATEKFYTLDEIADEAEHALIASEDKDFFEHGGFSLRSMAGALVGNLLNLELTKYGGSTITQQLVKNNLLTDKKNYLRKYQELSIAIAIERQYSKDEILELYLNSVYYGEGAFGIEQAARTYFDKLPAELSLEEASMLIGLLPAPSAYSPISGNIEQSKQQQERVLTAMSEADYITGEQADSALETNLTYADIKLNDQEHAHHFSRMVMTELEERYGEEQVTRSGFRVRTSIDLGQQKFAEQTVAERIEQASSQGATNGSLVAINPENGNVVALVGSADWDNESFGQVNMATSPRQPGSSFKPIYYAEALDKQLIT